MYLRSCLYVKYILQFGGIHLVLLSVLGNSLYVSRMVTGISSVIDEDARKFLAVEGHQSRSQAESRGWTRWPVTQVCQLCVLPCQ